MNSRNSNKAGKNELRTDMEGQSPAKLSRDIQAKLGDQLRQMYNDVISQGVPDRFADLLAKIDQSPQSGGEKADGDDKGSK
jgi:hypothetical protein